MSDRWIPFDIADAHEDPFEQFSTWYNEALGEMREREAIALVTATADAHPTARMVLLRYIGDGGFGWYSNYESRKGRDLEENPNAAILWYCEPLGRQIRIEGTVAKMNSANSDEYFASRPRGHQVGAHASQQSRPIATRKILEEQVEAAAFRFEGTEIPRPGYWGGYLLTPTAFEFWQHRKDRLHDRLLYTQVGEGWHRERHCP
jgi:pyridoxamine 5'-phosphate oxidase